VACAESTGAGKVASFDRSLDRVCSLISHEVHRRALACAASLSHERERRTTRTESPSGTQVSETRFCTGFGSYESATFRWVDEHCTAPCRGPDRSQVLDTRLGVVYRPPWGSYG
jgi:hypothetical protein